MVNDGDTKHTLIFGDSRMKIGCVADCCACLPAHEQCELQ